MNFLSLIYPLYERYLSRQIEKSSSKLPKHVALILSETDLLDPKGFSRLRFVLLWFKKFKVRIVSIYVDIVTAEPRLKAELTARIASELEVSLSGLPAGIGYNIYGMDGEMLSQRTGEDFFIYVSVGFGGRSEITKAVLSILQDIKAGNIKTEDVNEELLESRLLVKHEPDVMIRSGGQNLSDFLVWQSVYSELFFTDVNWHDIRTIDLLRIIRDFQKRQRRYGK